MDIITVGEMVIDFLPGDEPGIYIRKPGGAPANTAIAIARGGLTAGFCGRVGDDDFGKFLYDVLRDNGVRALCPEPVREATTTMAFVTLNERGDRSFTFARKPGADMLHTRADVDAAGIRDATVVHAGSCSLSKDPAADATAYALRCAREAGCLVSFDVNYRDLLWDGDRKAAAEAVRGILPLVDLLKISDEETDILCHNGDIGAEARRLGISVLVRTLGADGAECFWNGEMLRVPGRKANCVDTTGAGDAFWGGFLSGLLKAGVRSTADITAPLLRAAMDRGNVAGWLCVQKKGAIESLPTAAEIDRILQEEHA
jgi:fructokinase